MNKTVKLDHYVTSSKKPRLNQYSKGVLVVGTIVKYKKKCCFNMFVQINTDSRI